MRTPRSTRLTLTRLLRNRPAEMSSVIESAICAVTSAVRSRAAARGPDGCPVCPLRADTRSGLVLASAGSRPNARPVIIEITAANTSTGELMSGVNDLAASRGSMAEIPDSVHVATSRPAAPPIRARMPASSSNWPTSCHRPAPSDRRTAISVDRAAPRARSRLAMLTQAIRSTMAVTDKRKTSG
jgi:hypothetical protein